ncbi:hypothetical protein AVEN_53637-1 [Araneus ventricosus]|uniref:Uncharacterized protein n=1 Tax=Araneus ventricosus TaxID=182803 RepID=A0A4Y2RL13_ARAVE|nr:hypothetical protein AVEN_53637-1 [Araneus ventricosus]
MCDEEGDSRKYSLSDNSSYQSAPDADREMAVQAFQEFEKQKYDESLSLLNKLLSKRSQDAQVLHNCAFRLQKEKDVQKEENNDNGISDVLKCKLQLCKARSYDIMNTAKASTPAHQCAGEALLIMGRITEAVEHSNFQCANEIELAFPVSSSEVSLKHQMRFDSKLNEKNDDGWRGL